MFQLESNDDMGRKLVFPLVKVMTTVGRDPNCDIELTDNDVSRRHAKIYLMGGKVKVKDEDSVNGTFVENVRISEMTDLPINRELIIGSNQFFLRQMGDVIEDDDLKLTTLLTVDQLRDMTDSYENLLDEVPPDTEDMARTIMVDKQEILENIYLKKINLAVYPSLEVIFGSDKGKKYLLTYGGDHRLGRSETCNIRLNDPMVSGLHGGVEVTDEGVVYTDEGSRNGSILNNKIVSTHPLKHGDVMVLGSTKLKYTHPEQARLEARENAPMAVHQPELLWYWKYGLWLGIGSLLAILIILFFYLTFSS